MSEIVIETKEVKKAYDSRVLFENVSIQIEKGKTIGLVGENGSGKSVFYKCIVGLVKPDEGTVFVNSEQVGKKKDFPENVGILINEPGYISGYSGLKNLQFLAAIQNKVGEEEIVGAMKKVGLDPKNKTKVKNYSLGMKQKLGKAQAIMENQQIVILDEPFNGLDFKTKADIFGIIKTLKEEGKTILLTSHNFDDIKNLCDEIYLLSGAKIEPISDEMIQAYDLGNM